MTASNKALELQLQMKQNAEELQDFMRELESWEKDIKEVDSELRKQSGVSEEVKSVDLWLLLFILRYVSVCNRAIKAYLFCRCYISENTVNFIKLCSDLKYLNRW